MRGGVSYQTVWEFECLNCGYRLAEAMVNQARFDYGCPKCGCSFEQLTYKKREEVLEDEGAMEGGV